MDHVKLHLFILFVIIIIMDGEEMVGSDSSGLLRIVIVFFTRDGATLLISLAVLQYVFVVMLSINYSDMCDTGMLIC